MKNADMFFTLSVLSDLLQISNYSMNVEQLSNDDIIRELKEQNNAYLDKIISNQQEIIDKLNILLKIKE